MNPELLDELRDTLRRDARHIQPVGLGADVVRRRGRRRRHRGRAVVAAGSAACLTCVGVAVATRRPAPDRITLGAAGAGGGSAPALDFRVVDGEVGYSSGHFTTSAGVTYSLSTAPGVAGNPNDTSQTIYRTADGEHWETADQGTSWISDLSERDGVLYAVGTAPGASASDVRYRVGTSNDGGRDWNDTDLPFDLTPPSATVPLSRTSLAQVARGAHATVALLSVQFWPDLTSLLAQYQGDGRQIDTRAGADGFSVIDYTDCMTNRQKVAYSGATQAVRSGAPCTDPPVIGTIPWSEIGLRSGADLSRQQVLVSTDGSRWGTAAAPAAGTVRDVVATADGFLLLAANGPDSGITGRPGSSLWHSTDARSWTQVATPAGLDVQAVNGDRVVGFDDAGNVRTSTDGGTTWSATDVGSLVPGGVSPERFVTAEAGPLGFAVLVGGGGSRTATTPAHDVLLFSADGTSWRTTDLADEGAPVGGAPMQVTVGVDHIAVDYELPVAGGPMKAVTILATPQR